MGETVRNDTNMSRHTVGITDYSFVGGKNTNENMELLEKYEGKNTN